MKVVTSKAFTNDLRQAALGPGNFFYCKVFITSFITGVLLSLLPFVPLIE